MILPGISGAYILVLLGKYHYILEALNNKDFFTLFIISAGALVGLISFAQILGWLLKRYHDLTMAILIGLMCGLVEKNLAVERDPNHVYRQSWKGNSLSSKQYHPFFFYQ